VWFEIQGKFEDITGHLNKFLILSSFHHKHVGLIVNYVHEKFYGIEHVQSGNTN
jgi:hypothetical protein